MCRVVQYQLTGPVQMSGNGLYLPCLEIGHGRPVLHPVREIEGITVDCHAEDMVHQVSQVHQLSAIRTYMKTEVNPTLRQRKEKSNFP